jgi:ubiquinone/menaquinone biosynthesis C-methylase UbiE
VQRGGAYGALVERDEPQRYASSFGTAAAAYAEHRPDYAPEAVAWALDIAPGTRVLDLGAGTGKLTATLVEVGAEVTAVEPDAAMLAELRRSLPAVPALAGSAEAIPLPDSSVDGVVAGNAMHWFDMDVAGPEIARILPMTAFWPVCGTSSTTGSTGSPSSRA